MKISSDSTAYVVSQVANNHTTLQYTCKLKFTGRSETTCFLRFRSFSASPSSSSINTSCC